MSGGGRPPPSARDPLARKKATASDELRPPYSRFTITLPIE
jgi:hypothetical protein